MNKLSRAERSQVVAAQVEGSSVRSTVRMTGISKPTILKLLVDLGPVCAKYQDQHLRRLRLRRIQCDEIWQFCYAKSKNVPESKRSGQFGYGDVCTWVAVDADTKLVPAWRVGPRHLATAYDFMHDLAERLANRIQLTTDGFKVYLEAVESAFYEGVDYAMLQKVYGIDPQAEKRYSPAKIISTQTEVIEGEPNPKHISTSYVERQNLTMRMSVRRFARLTDAFSKKITNHEAMVSLHFMHYNFARIHQTLRITPAMAAGVSDHIWSIEEIVELLEAAESEGQKAA